MSSQALTRGTEVCPYVEPSVSLRQGDKGDSVRWPAVVPCASSCYSVGSAGIDGDFGSSTNSSVRSFQSSHGLAVDGIVGPATRAALKSAYSGNTVAWGKSDFSILICRRAECSCRRNCGVSWNFLQDSGYLRFERKLTV